ncbi:MAG: hypothetical protein N2Z70_00460 [Bdellovibrionaceae bacterium]|nr:hypothetical protein [Pseudobdellovibrionaceae bacterium]
MDLKQFNKEFVPIYLAEHPVKSKVGAALACSFLWTFAKDTKSGDIVLCPNGEGAYLIGEVISDYFYQPGDPLPHRKSVKWFNRKIQRSDMSENLKKTAGATETVRDISKYSIELDILIFNKNLPHTIVTDTDVEDPFTFVLEKHLEEFLIKNWNNTNFGKHYNIYEEDGEVVGIQRTQALLIFLQ